MKSNRRKQKRGVERVVESYLGELDTGEGAIDEIIEACLNALDDIEPNRARELRKTMNELIELLDFEGSKYVEALRKSLNQLFEDVVWVAMMEHEPPYFSFRKDCYTHRYGYYFDSDSFERDAHGRDTDVVKVEGFDEAYRDICERVVNETSLPEYYAVVNDHGNVTLITFRTWMDKRGKMYVRKEPRVVWAIV